MKLSFAIPKELDALSLGEFEEFVAETSAMGYVAVEPLINDPKVVDVRAINDILDKYQMKISGLRTGSIYHKNGWRLSSPDQENRGNAVARLKEVIVLASALQSNIMVGLMQGHLTTDERLEQAKELIIQGLRECTQFAAPYGVTIMLEAVNRFELAYHNTTAQLIDLLGRINRDLTHPVRLLLDVYHMHLEDPSIPSAFIRGMPYLGHVHFSDSNRCAPGSGGIDFVEAIKDLQAMDYRGYVTVEIHAIPSILGSAERSMNYLKPIIEAVYRP